MKNPSPTPRSHSPRPLLWGLALVLAAGTTACVSETEVDEPSTEQAEAALDAAADGDLDRPERHGAKGHRGHHRGGPHGLIHTALDELELTDAQRGALQTELDDMREGMKRDHHPKDFEEKAAALAEAVRAGAVDPTAFGIDASKHEARMKAGHARVVAAIDTLHATLTPEQRAELVSILEERHADQEARMAKWKEKRGDGEGRARKHRGKHGPLGHLMRGLDVSDEQRQLIEMRLDQAGLGRDRDAMKQRFAEMKSRHEAMLKAFATDSFDAATAMPPPPAEMARGPQRMVESLATIVPVLDDSQREELAQRIEQGPKRMRGKRGHRGERDGAERHHRRGDRGRRGQR